MKTIISLFSCILLLTLNNSLSAQFGGGNGTVEDPYRVANADHLNQIRNNLDAHFVQIDHIDLGQSPWNVVPGWVPIGTNPIRFTGSYDGGGFEIRNLYIRRGTTGYQGLFGGVSGVLRNITIVGADLEAGISSGILVGNFINGALSNIKVSGTIVSTRNRIGGVAGENIAGTIHHAHAQVTVTGADEVGGVVGYGTGRIGQSSSLGEVSGVNRVGGMVGFMTRGIIADSYSLAIVNGNNETGGLVGRSGGGGTTLYYLRSFSAGLVNAGGSSVGGLTGLVALDTKSYFSYWDMDKSTMGTSPVGIGLTNAQMQSQDSYKYFPFEIIWKFDIANEYPYHIDYSENELPLSVQLSGTGTVQDPYKIYSLHDLNTVRNFPADHFVLMNDIDLSSAGVWDYGNGWKPIVDFSGSLNGQGYAIRNLLIVRIESAMQGIFGNLSGEVSNLELENANVISGSSSGLFAGKIESGATVYGLITNGIMFSISDLIGGVAGETAGSISYITTGSSVYGRNQVGGVTGLLTGNLSRSYSTGYITAMQIAGGSVGWLNRGTIMNSYSKAEITSENIVGGLVGQMGSGGLGNSTIHHSYSVSNILSSGEHTGGLVGRLTGFNAYDVESSYWDTQATGIAMSAIGEGRNTAEMQYPYSHNTFVNWDFDTIWNSDHEYTVFNGYPYQDMHNRVVTSIDTGDLSLLPVSIRLYQNYPNPFNPHTTIRYHISEAGHVMLEIFDVTGRNIQKLDQGWRSSGIHTLQFNASSYASGVYVLSLTSGGISVNRKIMFLK